MKFIMNMLLTCILYCDTGRGCDKELFASIVGRFLSGISYLSSYVLRRSFTSRKLYVCLEILCFLQLSEKKSLHQEIVDYASHFPR